MGDVPPKKIHGVRQILARNAIASAGKADLFLELTANIEIVFNFERFF